MRITRDIVADSYADSEQPKVFRKDMLLSETPIWQEEDELRKPRAGADFRRDLRKTSRRGEK